MDKQQAIQELERRGVWGYLEPLLTMGSAVVAEPVSGIAGLVSAPFGANQAASTVEGVQEAMTYQPRSLEGQRTMERIGSFLQPVGDAFIGASEYLGDAAYDATGSPAAATAAYSMPTVLLEALGLKGASKLSGKSYEFGDIGTQSSKIGGKQRGIFAGIKAKNADLSAMEAAQELQKRGVSRDEIWTKTGWFKDVDGHWKFEIDDSRSIPYQFTDRQTQSLYGDSGFLARDAGDFLNHKELYQAYPDTKEIGMMVHDNYKDRGSYTRPTPDTDTEFGLQEEINLGANSRGIHHSTALHELQHSIQQREGFASGGSASDFAGDIRAAQAEVGRVNEQLSYISKNIDKLREAGRLEEAKLLKNEYQKVMDYKLKTVVPKAQLEPIDLYKRLAGEAEARNVEARKYMRPDERRQTPPWQTLDVPEDELITRF